MNAVPAQTWIVVPCYNEADRLPVQAFTDFARTNPIIGFCMVNDGSTDGTSRILQSMAASHPGQIEALDLQANQGKAEAVRRGVNHVLQPKNPDRVGYWDADLATPLEEIPRFIEIMNRRPEIKFACGSRVRRMGAVVRRKTHRHILGRVFATIASQILGMPAYDTQCGAKLIDAGLARQIFDRPFISRWIFDVELLMRIRQLLGLQATIDATLEIPLERWEERGESKVRAIHFLRAPLELWRIWRSYR